MKSPRSWWVYACICLCWLLYEMVGDKACKSASTIAQPFYEVICRQVYMETQIKEKDDQGKEFVNKHSNSLYNMTGNEQHITSSYQP